MRLVVAALLLVLVAVPATGARAQATPTEARTVIERWRECVAERLAGVPVTARGYGRRDAERQCVDLVGEDRLRDALATLGSRPLDARPRVVPLPPASRERPEVSPLR